MTKFMPLQVAVRIAKIDALSAPGPGASVLDAYAMFGKPPLPILIVPNENSVRTETVSFPKPTANFNRFEEAARVW
jgi:hypothetical protein